MPPLGGVLGATVLSGFAIAGLEGWLLGTALVAVWPAGFWWGIRTQKKMRRDEILCESIDDERVVVRAPPTWKHVLRDEQPGLLYTEVDSGAEVSP
jgi:hypothetical protein